MAKGIMEIGDSSFDSEVLQAEKPVLVDFWAPWCGPCRAIAPIVEELAESFGDMVKFAKLRPSADESWAILVLGRELVQDTVPEPEPEVVEGEGEGDASSEAPEAPEVKP